MCDHYDRYNDWDDSDEKSRIKKQAEMLNPIKKPMQQISEEIKYLKNRLSLLEKQLNDR